MQALATQLASQLAAWHNRNPLARRVRPESVHTIGVVALPFMRSGVPQEQIEPALSSLEDSPAPVAEPEAPAKPALLARLRALPALLSALLRRRAAAAGAERWPVFSERFIGSLSPRAIGRFASRSAYRQRPDDGSWPQRVVPVDETLAARPAPSGAGAWPEELYLLSAAIDAGPTRTRVLLAQGAGQSWHVLGRRSLDPRRLALLGVVLAALLTAGLALQLRSGDGTKAAPSAASAASGASATGRVVPLEAASAPSSAASAGAIAASASSSPAASDAASAASAPTEPGPASGTMPGTASSAAANLGAVPASQLPDRLGTAQDIRPQLVPTRGNRPLPGASAPVREAPASASDARKPPAAPPAEAASEGPAKDKPAERADRSKPATPAPAGTRGGKAGKAGAASAPAETVELPRNIVRSADQASGSGPLVALVSPPLATEAEAEAYLQRMVPIVLPLAGRRGLEQQVLHTPDGWRAAIWPFASREEAQLINAMLIARGLRARAVDF